MRDMLYLGPNVDIVNLSLSEAKDLCEKYVAHLKQEFGEPPHDTTLSVQIQDTGEGQYPEVVVVYEETSPESTEYAFNCEGASIEAWQDAPSF